MRGCILRIVAVEPVGWAALNSFAGRVQPMTITLLDRPTSATLSSRADALNATAEDVLKYCLESVLGGGGSDPADYAAGT